MKKIPLFNLVLISTVLVLFSNCVATKKQKDNFLAKYCERKDSIRVVTKEILVKKDSTIYIPTIINTPIYLENPCKLLCDSLGNLRPFIKTEKKGGLKTTIKSVGNVLVVECETDSLKARISWLERNLVSETFSHTENTVEKPCKLDHKTKFDGFTFWWFWLTVSILSVWSFFKFGKGYLKNYLPFLK